eukprot:1694488-Rhodomonas_salina.4
MVNLPCVRIRPELRGSGSWSASPLTIQGLLWKSVFRNKSTGHSMHPRCVHLGDGDCGAVISYVARGLLELLTPRSRHCLLTES